MDLIYYHGVNCRLASLINIAALLDENYFNAFGNLWSETDFKFESEHNLFVSERIHPNLEAVGVMTETLISDGIKTDADISQIQSGEFLLVGTDVFHTPWHPLYNYGHELHYFFARKEPDDLVACSDSIYNIADIKIKAEVLRHSFELSRVYKTDVIPPEINLAQEAKEVLRKHPAINEILQNEIFKCKSEKNIISNLSKIIRAMISNRYLFADFLHNSASVPKHCDLFFDKKFMKKWEAVANGLYKAALVKDNSNTLDEVHMLLSNLMREEIAAAENIINF